MEKPIRWGIIGLGNIAQKFARGLKCRPDALLAAVASRTLEKAEKFAEEFGVPKAYGSYTELASDSSIDIVYIATPHPFHKENTLLCLEAGKPVLCEKPFAINAEDAREMVSLARKKGVFLMEAMWTRYLPVTLKVKDWINSYRIGEVRMLTADFGYRTSQDYQARTLNSALGGGGLLDVGIYPVSYTYLLFKEKPSKIVSLAHIGKSGVDEQSAVIFQYSRGQLAQISSAVRTRTQGEAWIIGTEGSIHVPEFWRASSATLFIGGKETERVQIPFESNGYEYEAAEAMNCLREGKLESPIMPLDETISIMDTLDQIRGQWGLKYPMEK